MDTARAFERVQIKERQMTGGYLDGVTLDARHPTALRFNNIARGMETMSLPVPGKDRDVKVGMRLRSTEMLMTAKTISRRGCTTLGES